MGWVAPTSDIVVAAAGIVVAGSAILALRTWRTEMMGRATFDLARQLVLESHRFENDFRAARNPFTFPGESADRKRGENESDEEAPVYDEWYARSKRNRPLFDDWAKLQELRWQATAVYETDTSRAIGEAMDKLGKERGLYLGYFDAYFRQRIESIRTPGFGIPVDQDLADVMKVWRDAVYERGEDDPFSRMVVEARDAIERAVEPYLRARQGNHSRGWFRRWRKGSASDPHPKS